MQSKSLQLLKHFPPVFLQLISTILIEQFKVLLLYTGYFFSLKYSIKLNHSIIQPIQYLNNKVQPP